ncbi:hypothetical protein HDV00_001055 [Rhizophlyctis rosea]|nr:hypothetical protein HDV00_001055 [Rhizophlyctis rosea]
MFTRISTLLRPLSTLTSFATRPTQTLLSRFSLRTPSPASASALLPTSSLQQTAGYRTKVALKLRCQHCFFAVRRGKVRVICKENPRHKQVHKYGGLEGPKNIRPKGF